MARRQSSSRISPPRNVFIFQCRAERFDLRTELVASTVSVWEANRYRLAMRAGDIVYFWMAGNETIRGIYGWGTIKKPPYPREGQGYCVDVTVSQVFSTPVLAQLIKRDSSLQNLLILKAPQATNFLLSAVEARELGAFVTRQGERAPEGAADPMRVTTRGMPAGSSRRPRHRVFVSYSHADAEVLQRLQVHLAPLKQGSSHDIWDDTRIAPGQVWKTEITKALNAAKAAVLVVSADFLASPFIMEEEVPKLLAAASDEGAVILPIIVSPCRFVETSSLSRFQSVNPPSRPLSALNTHERELVFYKVSIAVEAALARARAGHD